MSHQRIEAAISQSIRPDFKNEKWVGLWGVPTLSDTLWESDVEWEFDGILEEDEIFAHIDKAIVIIFSKWLNDYALIWKMEE